MATAEEAVNGVTDPVTAAAPEAGLAATQDPVSQGMTANAAADTPMAAAAAVEGVAGNQVYVYFTTGHNNPRSSVVDLRRPCALPSPSLSVSQAQRRCWAPTDAVAQCSGLAMKGSVMWSCVT